MKIQRKIIEIDESICNGCGECVPTCAEGALTIIAGKAKLMAEKYCDGLGACLGGCPTGALKIIERSADDFDEVAVEEMLQAKKAGTSQAPALDCGCASSYIQNFREVKPALADYRPRHEQNDEPSASALSHWPVQIRLVPPTAEFLKKADLLVAADCTAFAFPAFHQDFLPGKKLMVGCSKFDDAASYVAKFTEIFATADLKSITILIMEVPCCAAMTTIIKTALAKSGRRINVQQAVISTRGQLLRLEKW